MALREREELLGSVKKDIDAFNKQGDHCGLYLSYPHPPPFPKAFTYSMANFKFLSHSVWPGTCLIGGEGESSSNSRVHIEHACWLLSSMLLLFLKTFSNLQIGSTGLNRRSELFMKETDHLRNSERLIDDQIAIAMATKENLTQQRGAFHSISQRLVNTLHKFPLINSLVQRINLRKRRDSIILASVIAICLILLILYSLRNWCVEGLDFWMDRRIPKRC